MSSLTGLQQLEKIEENLCAMDEEMSKDEIEEKLCAMDEEMDKDEVQHSTDVTTKDKEAVNHPPHYGGKDNPYEAIKVIRAYGMLEGFCLGSALKYISRAGKKQPDKKAEDLKKAAWYLNYLANEVENS